MSRFIVTHTPYFKKSVVDELHSVDLDTTVIKRFDNSIMLVESKLDERQFIQNLKSAKPIFIKHICPATYDAKLLGNLEKDKQEVLQNILNKNIEVKNGEKFAIQCRIVAGGSEDCKLDYSSKDIEVFVGTYFTDKGGVPTFSDRNIVNEGEIKVISIFINGFNSYFGVSSSVDNLNFACDEYRVASKAGGREISRAENKLKEALAKYNLKLNGEGGIALDIGAAPGGWTKVLLDHGYRVVAVDPGDLNPELQHDDRVKHYKCRIEDLKFDNYFDIIVNDMNVDPNVTANIMNSLSHCLKEKGKAIVTFKLPDKPVQSINEGKEIISKGYNVLSVNSLFHNRQEVTVFVEKKSPIRDLTI